DYCSQGQTIPAVIVEIATSSTGKRCLFPDGHVLTLVAGGLSLFNLYVALFRSSVFQAAHCPELLAENDRLETLNNKTLKEWRDAGRDTRNRSVGH
ncbi:hypothetical protein SCLCIDRAFT_126544, partial [Scleroderma citrinum Foug A]